MKSYDCDAVIFDGEIYCISCLPENVSKNEYDPIFADSEWQSPPVCHECGEIHEYVLLINNNKPAYRAEVPIWCIQKVSRWSENPCPYDGPAIHNAGIKAKYYYNKDEALRDAKIITEYNPVGFSVVEAKKLHSAYTIS
jgi:hypothetical protein